MEMEPGCEGHEHPAWVLARARTLIEAIYNPLLVLYGRGSGASAQLRFEQLRRRVVPFAEARSYLTYGGRVVKVFADKRCCLELTLFSIQA